MDSENKVLKPTASNDEPNSREAFSDGPASSSLVADPPTATVGKKSSPATGSSASEAPAPEREPRASDARGTYYATTPIFYVNAAPHIGHAYTTILVDVATRFHRLRGDDTFFLTGTDEHGENVQKAAEAHGETPQEYADQISSQFRATWDRLGIRYDDFIRTTEDRHKKVVSEVLQRVYDSGDIVYGEYAGLYCVKCERYYTDKELVDGKCPQHEIVPEYRTEANYFFRMEKYRHWLRDTLTEQPDLIRPERYRNEVLAMLREPIGDLSISRPRSRVPWGIPLPWDDEHVTYVWFDALINYYSVLVAAGTLERYWPHAEHFVAKDILKPHGLFWPIMLKAAGIPLFQHLNVHGYWLIEDRKMSKSLGNVVRPLDLQEKYGNDAFRYFLMRDMTFGLDSSFSETAVAERINADLANDLGNLLNRTLGMIGRYYDGLVPAAGPLQGDDLALKETFVSLPARLEKRVAALQFDRAIEDVMEAVRKANKYIADVKPWELARDEAEAERLGTVLNTLVEALRCASVLLDPVIPGKAHELRKQLGIRNAPFDLASAAEWGLVPAGTKTQPGEPLFPRIDLDELRAQIEGQEDDAALEPLEHKEPVSIDEFGKLELRVVTVEQAEQHPNADKLLVLTVRMGPETRTVVSGIKEHYDPSDLVGKKLVLVANLKPVKLRGIESQGMILSGEGPDGTLGLITLERDLPDGSEVR